MGNLRAGDRVYHRLGAGLLHVLGRDLTYRIRPHGNLVVDVRKLLATAEARCQIATLHCLARRGKAVREPIMTHAQRGKSARPAATVTAATGADSSRAPAAAETVKTKDHLYSEIRYAIRLTERTSRLYRRAQSAGTFLSIIGGSAIVATIGGNLPIWLTTAGIALFTIAGAALIAIRPTDKAAQNDADARRYQALLAKASTMGDAELEEALEDARRSDASEIEPLRDVAYNDVAIECGRADMAVPLSVSQRVLQALA